MQTTRDTFDNHEQKAYLPKKRTHGSEDGQGQDLQSADVSKEPYHSDTSHVAKDAKNSKDSHLASADWRIRSPKRILQNNVENRQSNHHKVKSIPCPIVAAPESPTPEGCEFEAQFCDENAD